MEYVKSHYWGKLQQMASFVGGPNDTKEHGLYRFYFLRSRRKDFTPVPGDRRPAAEYEFSRRIESSSMDKCTTLSVYSHLVSDYNALRRDQTACPFMATFDFAFRPITNLGWDGCHALASVLNHTSAKMRHDLTGIGYGASLDYYVKWKPTYDAAVVSPHVHFLWRSVAEFSYSTALHHLPGGGHMFNRVESAPPYPAQYPAASESLGKIFEPLESVALEGFYDHSEEGVALCLRALEGPMSENRFMPVNANRSLAPNVIAEYLMEKCPRFEEFMASVKR